MRKIKLANAQKRDAEIVFGGLIQKPVVKYVLPDGSEYRNIKLLKSDIYHQYESLLARYGDDEQLAQDLIHADPELDLLKTGMIISGGQKVLVNQELKPVYKVNVTEMVYNPDGSLKEAKPFSTRNQNVFSDFPISWTGKQLPIAEAYNRFIFAKKYQLTHTNGLTFDFLYSMAKELHENQTLMLLAGGPKGNEPLIFQENGRPYRAFLEGRIKDQGRILFTRYAHFKSRIKIYLVVWKQW